MTISTTTNRVSYAGNGVTTVFAFAYRFLQDADLVVIEKTNSTGAEVIKTLTTDYTVSGAGGNTGGNVTMLTAPAAGKTLVIYRDPVATQTLDLRENDLMPAEELEKAYDKATMLIQRLKDRFTRAITLKEGYTASFDLTLPAILTADKVLAINPTGDGFVLGPSIGDISGAAASAAAAAASAGASAASASSANTSATNAATSATNASTSETNAANSAAAAAASATAAAIAVGTPKQEVPTGAINGINTSLGLSQVPKSNAHVLLYLDSTLQYQGSDYTVAGQVITMAVAPGTGQKPYATYTY